MTDTRQALAALVTACEKPNGPYWWADVVSLLPAARAALSAQPVAGAVAPQAFGDLKGVSPCCGEYANCHRPCTPRGRWEAQRMHEEDVKRYEWLREHTVATGLSRWMDHHQFLDAAVDKEMTDDAPKQPKQPKQHQRPETKPSASTRRSATCSTHRRASRARRLCRQTRKCFVFARQTTSDRLLRLGRE